jgi:hypothetical protein
MFIKLDILLINIIIEINIKRLKQNFSTFH